MADETQEYLDFLKAIGPKRVDTKEIEVEAHDPLKVQKTIERIKPKGAVLFSQFAYTKVVPKCNVACCYETDKDCDCG